MYKVRFFLLLLLLIHSLQALLAQSVVDFAAPLKIPLFLSANYAELRSSHFHSGIDYKTQGRTGIPIYAIEDGYIYRLKISPVGYGKSIYINHPNGYTSVYGHLESYTADIEKYMKNLQYKNRSFDINHFPEKNKIFVKKGQLIGYSGNSGNSFGPHLHFEIRETKSEIPLNPLNFLDIPDTISPYIYSIFVYQPDKQKSYLVKTKTKYSVRKHENSFKVEQDTLYVEGKFKLGIETHDFLNYSNNKCGISEVNLFADSLLVFSANLDRISFNESRYILSYMDYEENLKTRAKVHRLFVEPNNKLSVYEKVINRGIIQFDDKKFKNIKIVLKDVSGNTSSIDFVVKRRDEAVNTHIIEKMPITEVLMPYSETNSLINEDVKIVFPENTFYDTLCFVYDTTKESSNKYNSAIYHIHNEYVPVHKRFYLSFSTNLIPENFLKKAVVCRILQKTNDAEFDFYETEVKKDYITAYPNSFGDFVLMIDTVPPEIEPANFTVKSLVDFSNNSSVQFKIVDNISGIKSYNGFIDDKWVLFEYDKKNDLFFHIFDKDRINFNKNHELKLIVSDYNQNIEVFEMTFYK